MHRSILWSFALFAWLTAFSAATAAEPSAGPAPIDDSRLRAATELVLHSDRYLHQSRLRRGMRGYGLTVMAGTEIVKFDVEIVSVMEKYTPHRDMILAYCRGHGLEESGIIAGMSGSPVYIVDPADGKPKLIGAVAYGWSYSKQPIAGIQPINQMLAVSGIPLGEGAPRMDVATSSADGGRASVSGRVSGAWAARAFDPRKTDFTRFGWPREYLEDPQPAQDGAQLQQLTTPLMAGGLTDRSQRMLGEALAGLNMMPVQSGGVGRAAAEEVQGLKLEPGSAVCVPLVVGDEDLSAVGTVTEVIGEHVLGFGHPMFGNGSVSYPMATGYVHVVLPSVSRSVKLASNVEIVGELTSDESTAIGGRVGRPVGMIPVTVEVTWPGGQTQTYRYQILRERFFTPLLAGVVASDSVYGTRNLPQEHTVAYEVRVDFGELGEYRVANFQSDSEISGLTSDLSRALSVMTSNPFGEARIESVHLAARIDDGSRWAEILGGALDRNAYAPGDTVVATLELQPYRGERVKRAVRVRLPGDLPDGQYALRIGDAVMATELLETREPQRFDPRNLRQLLDTLQLVTEMPANELYAVLDVNRAGVAVGRDALPDAPPTLAAALRASSPLEVTGIAQAVTVRERLDFELMGQAELVVTVDRDAARP